MAPSTKLARVERLFQRRRTVTVPATPSSRLRKTPCTSTQWHLARSTAESEKSPPLMRIPLGLHFAYISSCDLSASSYLHEYLVVVYTSSSICKLRYGQWNTTKSNYLKQDMQRRFHWERTFRPTQSPWLPLVLPLHWQYKSVDTDNPRPDPTRAEQSVAMAMWSMSCRQRH
jgi:hypothetical protein